MAYADPKKIRNKPFLVYVNQYELEQIDRHIQEIGEQRGEWARAQLMRSTRPYRRASDHSMSAEMA